MFKEPTKEPTNEEYCNYKYISTGQVFVSTNHFSQSEPKLKYKHLSQLLLKRKLRLKVFGHLNLRDHCAGE